MYIKLDFEFGFNPIWIAREEIIGAPENEIPEEWESDQEVKALNERIGNMWDSFYIDEIDKPFEFVGPKSPEEKQLFKALCDRLIVLVHKHADGKYQVIDDLTAQIEEL